MTGQKRLLAILVIFISLSLEASDYALGLWYSGVNPDYKPFESQYGAALSLKAQYKSGLFSRVLYNSTDFLASGPEVGRVGVENWLEVGLGYQFPDSWSNFYSYLSYSRAESDRELFTGTGIHVGVQNQWTEHWHSRIQFGYLDMGFRDFQLEGQITYRWDDNIDFSFGLRDYDDWDYTTYEAGILFHF